jgi:beta-lactam-binding protein with PASTA domain
LTKEEKKYKKVIKDYMNILQSSRSGSAVTYVYSRDKKYLEAIQETIKELKKNFKNKNNR